MPSKTTLLKCECLFILLATESEFLFLPSFSETFIQLPDISGICDCPSLFCVALTKYLEKIGTLCGCGGVHM